MRLAEGQRVTGDEVEARDRVGGAALLIFAVVIAGMAMVFATDAAAAPPLPDGRVIERVSAADTIGRPSIDFGDHAVPLDDDTVVYGGGIVPAAEGQSANNGYYVARRGAFGWEDASLLPDDVGGLERYALTDSTRDLSASVWSTGTTFNLGGTPPGLEVDNRLRYRNAAGEYATIVDQPLGGPPSPYGYSLDYGGMSQDGGSVVFSSHYAPVGSADPSGLRRLWRWHPGGGAEALATEPGSPLADCNLEVVGGSSDSYHDFGDEPVNAVSADGQTVFLHDGLTEGAPGPCPAEESEGFQVYVNTEGRTELVSAREGATEPEEGQASASFRGATPDGRTAWIETEAPLTEEDHFVAPFVFNLYRWEAPDRAAPAKLTCLTCGPAGTADRSEHYDNFLSVSGSRMYFVRLVEGEEGQPVPELFVDSGGRSQQVPFPFNSFDPTIEFKSADPSGDTVVVEYGGLYVISEDAGTGAYTVEPLARNAAGEAASGKALGLEGQATVFRGALQTAGLTGHAGGAVSDDGRTIVFESPLALAAGAEEAGESRPESGTLTNLYRWREGQLVYLGRSSTPAEEPRGIAVSGDGADIFFQSGEQLVPNELQTAPAIYDARIGGGFPRPPEGAPPCSGALACRGAATGPPASPPLPSTALAPTPTARRRTLLFRAPSASQLARFSRTGTLVLRVGSAGGGHLKVVARARIDGRSAEVASASRKVGSATATSTVRLRLRSAGRSALRRRGRLRLRLTASLPGAGTKTRVVTLRERGTR